MHSIPDQISKALDGRTQRWLSTEVNISEPELSNKMNGRKEFSEDEIVRIEKRLRVKIRREKTTAQP